MSLTVKDDVKEVMNRKPEIRVKKPKKWVDSQMPEKLKKIEKNHPIKEIRKRKVKEENVRGGRDLFRLYNPGTVRETQKMLRVFNQSKENETVEDEAVSTEVVFPKHSINDGKTNVQGEVTNFSIIS